MAPTQGVNTIFFVNGILVRIYILITMSKNDCNLTGFSFLWIFIPDDVTWDQITWYHLWNSNMDQYSTPVIKIMSILFWYVQKETLQFKEWSKQ